MSRERLAKMIVAIGVPEPEAVEMAGRLQVGSPFPPGPKLNKPQTLADFDRGLDANREFYRSEGCNPFFLY